MTRQDPSKQRARDRGALGWLYREVSAWVISMQFLTLAPPLIRRPLEMEELGRAVGYFALSGAVLGALLAGLNSLLGRFLPGGVTAALLLAIWVFVTGALHLDGFLDSCDGLWGGHTPEDRLRIMRDERVGAYGLAGGVLLLLLEYAALVSLADRMPALLLAPTLGRWSMSLAMVAFPYARPQGLGRAMKDHATWGRVALATAVALLVAWVVLRWRGLIVVAVAGMVTWGGARYAQRRLLGLTGDIYGAICVLVELTTLLALTASWGVLL